MKGDYAEWALALLVVLFIVLVVFTPRWVWSLKDRRDRARGASESAPASGEHGEQLWPRPAAHRPDTGALRWRLEHEWTYRDGTGPRRAVLFFRWRWRASVIARRRYRQLRGTVRLFDQRSVPPPPPPRRPDVSATTRGTVSGRIGSDTWHGGYNP